MHYARSSNSPPTLAMRHCCSKPPPLRSANPRMTSTTCALPPVPSPLTNPPIARQLATPAAHTPPLLAPLPPLSPQPCQRAQQNEPRCQRWKAPPHHAPPAPRPKQPEHWPRKQGEHDAAATSRSSSASSQPPPQAPMLRRRPQCR